MAANPQRTKELLNLQRLQELTRSFSGPDREAVETVPAGGASPAAAPGADAEDPRQWGDFTLVRRTGEGHFARVYLAYDPKLDTRFALKLLKRRHIAEHGHRFISEARRLRQVQHPNIVTIHGVDEHDGRPGLWMDYLEGSNLEERLEQGTLCWREAAAIGLELCSALAAIHHVGLVHGDLKPANVMRVEGGSHHVVTDFGSSGLASPTTMLQSALCGTPLNMAPEILLQRVRNTPASDLYSLGVFLYRLVSGKYPVEASSCEELARKHASGDTVPLVDRCPDLPPEFLRIVNHALAFDPTQRYASAGHMERDLSALFVHDQWWEKLWSWVRAHRRRLALTAATAVVIAGALVFWRIPLRADAALYRLQADGAQVVEPETVLRPGDKLRLAYSGSHESFVYVYNEATKKLGEVNTIFPLEAEGLRNPLPPGKEHILPHEQWIMNVDDTGGTERILIIVSKEPLPRFQDRRRGIHPTPRGITSEPLPDANGSVLDRIVNDLGDPSWSLWWRVFELECVPSE
jgi:hypothetical protein